jgi:predicted O-linked N-acetylglucosamine transferase (SPINDLY family)
VTRSLAEYESRALALACDSSALAEVRAKLARNRPTYPLFDTARFTRHLEAAYERMMEIRYTGKPPTTFTVEPAGARAMSKIS